MHERPDPAVLSRRSKTDPPVNGWRPIQADSKFQTVDFEPTAGFQKTD